MSKAEDDVNQLFGNQGNADFIDSIPRFSRDLFGSEEKFTRIDGGGIGGKAHGLAFIRDKLVAGLEAAKFNQVAVNIPTMTVIGTDIFDAFVARNNLYEVALSGAPDDRIAHAFQQAEFPPAIIGDLRGLVEKVHSPLAVRSSSLLEDAIFRPFAGVYGTKMIPNNQPGAADRFKKLIEAIKFVYASTFFKEARDYIRITGKKSIDEKMAVIIQEVVGRPHGERFYPDISGVGRSYNYYPFGRAKPEEGVIALALGLGKTIVDGGKSWAYCPVQPKVAPPFGSTGELLKQTQSRFWAVNMGRPPAHDPIRETEYLIEANLADAEYDGTLDNIASTYQAQNDRIVMGTGFPGPRVLNFAPIIGLNEIPLTDLVVRVLEICQEAIGTPVEIEFAVTIDERHEPSVRFGFLQVRPMVVAHGEVDVAEDDLAAPNMLAASDKVMGHGFMDYVRDVVYVKPDRFLAKDTPAMVAEIDSINRKLVAEGRPYLLIGFGRWGSSDPWLGIPVNWAEISGAKAIVEATLPDMNVDPSQGSHFFHNITSFQIPYFSVHHAGKYKIDWDWLGRQTVGQETEHVRHVELGSPLIIKVDGKHSRGVISYDKS